MMAGVLDATYQYFENQFTGSREDVLMFLTFIGVVAILVM